VLLLGVTMADGLGLSYWGLFLTTLGSVTIYHLLDKELDRNLLSAWLTREWRTPSWLARVLSGYGYSLPLAMMLSAFIIAARDSGLQTG